MDAADTAAGSVVAGAEVKASRGAPLRSRAVTVTALRGTEDVPELPTSRVTIQAWPEVSPGHLASTVPTRVRSTRTLREGETVAGCDSVTGASVLTVRGGTTRAMLPGFGAVAPVPDDPAAEPEVAEPGDPEPTEALLEGPTEGPAPPPAAEVTDGAGAVEAARLAPEEAPEQPVSAEATRRTSARLAAGLNTHPVRG